MLRKKLLITTAITACMISTSANALLCQQFESAFARAFSISTTSNSNTIESFEKTNGFNTEVEEYGNLIMTMESCNDIDGSIVRVQSQKRVDMETVQEDEWIVTSKINLCNEESLDLSKPIILKGDKSKLTVKARKNREARYTFQGRDIYNKKITLFANEAIGSYN